MIITSFLITILFALVIRGIKSSYYAIHCIFVIISSSTIFFEDALILQFSDKFIIRSLIIHFIWINILLFLMYGIDKRAAIKKLYRIPERVLHGFALAGGSLSAIFASKFFRHKTSKNSFKKDTLLIIAIQLIIIVYIFSDF